ncbi:hypothetical protein GW17_00006840 [Ensete ventricosum]|nr:hypothetical protein GW17_00006840 [Ensete ventricosum]RZS28472.1 hypothetical protein BHM03_00062067 [Ensete ventricosum]
MQRFNLLPCWRGLPNTLKVAGGALCRDLGRIGKIISKSYLLSCPRKIELLKIMVRACAVDSNAEWRRLWWQRRTQGRKRPLRLGRSTVVVAVEARLRQKEEDEGSDYHGG